VRATLAEDTHVLRLVDLLHPTPAVGGLPRESALRFIEEHEKAERGWYAAPFGWVDCRGNGEFVVALRSGLLHRNKVHLYAGAGIVAGSNAGDEFVETELKLSGMLGALGVDD
jgi:isochorismate synthase EntC